MSNAPDTWWNPRRPAGFRFSWTDGLAIAVCAVVTWAAWPQFGELAILFPMVLGHFFLFCNVFRIGRVPELSWGAVFIVNTFIWLCLDRFAWYRVLAAQSPMTVLAISLAVFRQDYHGIGYQWIPWGHRPRSGHQGKAERG